jgi:hypothetical protein
MTCQVLPRAFLSLKSFVVLIVEALKAPNELGLFDDESL